jgi:type II secretory pathway predicted ATPase ExeA
MYCELFRLKEPPFRLTPDPQFLFASKQHARAKAYMESTIWLADGFVVITGDIGSGKTTLIESFLSELGDEVVIAHVNQTQLSPVEFLQALLVELGFKPFKMQKIELLTMLRDYMVEQYAAGKKMLLVIDEAQNLSRQVLEEVRMLSGIEAQKEKLLRIILAGQPELAAKLDSPRLEQLTQRVRLRFHLASLSKRETREYIEHRLRVAGADRAIFSDDAFDVVFRYSGGVPRLTNILCDTAMLCAFAEERDTVDAALVKAAVDELQWVEYAERVRSRGPSGSRERADINGRRERREITGRHQRITLQGPSIDLLLHDEVVSHYALAPGRAIIGRTPDNDLQIQSKFISRHHAQITTQGERCVIEDLNSTNGIFLGAKRIKQHTLSDGDVIQIGEHKLHFRGVQAAEGVDSPASGEEPEDEGGGASFDRARPGINGAHSDADADLAADDAAVDAGIGNDDLYATTRDGSEALDAGERPDATAATMHDDGMDSGAAAVGDDVHAAREDELEAQSRADAAAEHDAAPEAAREAKRKLSSS